MRNSHILEPLKKPGKKKPATPATNIPPISPAASVAASPRWIVPAKDRRDGGFSPFVAFCFTINYIVGTGFLTIPWAFAQGGIVLSTIILVIVGVFADMAKNYLLETMARAEAMLDLRMHWKNEGAATGGEEQGMLVFSPMIMPSMVPGETDELLEQRADPEEAAVGRGTIDYKSFNPSKNLSKVSSLSGSSTPRNLPVPTSVPGTPGSSQPGTPHRVAGRILVRHVPPAYLIRDRKFEMNTLCRVFLGKPGLHVFTLFISLYFFSTLWAYTSVFSSAMASVLPILDVDPSTSAVDSNNYLIYATVFGCVVVPLSCLELDEQITVQVLMTLSRFIMVALMVFTSQECADETRQRLATVGDGVVISSGDTIPWVRWRGIPRMLPILVFAFLFHSSIPGLAHPVQNKRKLKSIFLSTSFFCMVAYALIGIVLSLSFGPTLIEQSANLNWKHFHGRQLSPHHHLTTMDSGLTDAIQTVSSSLPTPTWWSQAISWYIICFPAMDVLSAFPLNAITLGNNIMGAYYGSQIHEVEHNRWIRTKFRLLASIPSIILGMLIRELGLITDYAGTAGFMIAFTVPGMLYIESKRIAKKKGFSASTYYSSYASSVPVAFTLALFGLCMMVYVFFNLLLQQFLEL